MSGRVAQEVSFEVFAVCRRPGTQGMVIIELVLTFCRIHNGFMSGQEGSQEPCRIGTSDPF